MRQTSVVILLASLTGVIGFSFGRVSVWKEARAHFYSQPDGYCLAEDHVGACHG